MRAVASGSDTVIVLGERSSADVTQLAEVARMTGADVHVTNDLGQIQPSWLSASATAGLVVSASARPGLYEATIEALSGIGPLCVVRRQVRSEVFGAPGSSSGDDGEDDVVAADAEGAPVAAHYVH